MRVLRLMARALIAVITAAVAPAIVFGVIARSIDAAVLALAIAFPHALVLGLPLFLLLRAKWRINAATSIAGGFLVGGFPMGVLGADNWPGNLLAAAMLGLFGAIGGLGFFLVWRILGDAPERAAGDQAN
jgi:hypothetical protein